MQKLEARYANTKLALKKDEMEVYQQDIVPARLYQRLSTMKQALNMQRSVLDAINDNEKMTREEKQQATDRIVSDMIMVAKTGDQIITGMK
jgi:response regulator RpfG family c-di-GMP phosphodiesterase